MLRALVAHAIRWRWLVVLACGVLVVYGAYRIANAGLDIFPEFSPKAVIVQTEVPGMTAEQVEIRVTLPLERALAGLNDLKHVRSESIEGLSIVTAVFEDGTDLFRNRQIVAERLASAQKELPARAAPVVVPLASSSATVRTIGLTAPALDPMALRDVVETALVPGLLGIPGVADVNVFGGGLRTLQIQFDPQALRRFNLSIAEILRGLRGALAPAAGLGFIENDNQRLSLVLAPDSTTPEALGELLLRPQAAAQLRLRDVAHITFDAAPPIGAASIMGSSGIVLMVIGQYGANTLTVSNAVGALLEGFRPGLSAQGVKLYPALFVPADYIETSLSHIAEHLLMGGALVAGVLLVFLFDLRAALIAAVAIPLSLMVAVLVLLAAGYNLNIMVLGGLAIALGEVVDDAIIDTENIYRRLREARQQASPPSLPALVLAASMEVRGSVVYASFIVALVFVPLLTLPGVAGRLFAPLGVTYIFAILASLLVALVVTPALCCLLLGNGRVPPGDPPLMRWLKPAYARLLAWVCARPLQVCTLTFALCGGVFSTVPGLGADFLPPLREGHYIAHTTELPGTSLRESMRVGERISAALMALPGVRSVSQWAGRAARGADTYGSHYSEYEIALAPMSGAAQASMLDQIRAVLASFPGLAFEANTFLTERVDETLSGYAAPVVVNLYGEDLGALDAKAREVAAVMHSVPGATDVQLRATARVPLVQVRQLPAEMARFGVSASELNAALGAAQRGLSLGQVAAGTRLVDALLIAAPAAREQASSLGELPLRGSGGSLVPLREVAAIEQVAGRYNVLHRNGQRLQSITCNVQGHDVGRFTATLMARLATEVTLPADMHFEVTGAAAEQAQSRRHLLVDSLLAGVAVLALVALALGSFRHVLLVLANLPFALAGGVLAVMMTGGSLSVGSLVGFVTLFGITVRNSIMLVSHYRQLVTVEGCAWDVTTAVRGATERLPSIAMTALVTALAMLPIALNSDSAGREILGPMAAIIIGGLASSAALNLLVMPALMLRFGRFERA